MGHTAGRERPGRFDPSVTRAEFTALLNADFRRNPSLAARTTLTLWRGRQVLNGQPGILAFVLRRVLHFFDALWTGGVIGSELPSTVTAGPGLRLPHAGRGIMIHPSVSIGSGVTLYHQTVLGVRDGRPGPRIGDNVEIGAGARILGPITVADGCFVGANAVLLTDTEPGLTYVGVPAQLVASRRHRR